MEGLFGAMIDELPVTEIANVLDWVTDGLNQQVKFKLFDDVSMVYELQLAKMEFSQFRNDLETFRKRTAYFEEVAGEKSWHFFLSAVEGKGQIGRSNQYLTHWFYPYKGKFHGQMVKALLNFMAVGEADTVLDPFVGSGTTLVECATLNVPSVGIDINPALCFVSLVKTQALAIDFPTFRRALHRLPLQKIFQQFTRQLEKPQPLQLPSIPFDGSQLTFAIWEQLFPDLAADLPIEWRNILLLIFLHALFRFHLSSRHRESKVTGRLLARELKRISQDT